MTHKREPKRDLLTIFKAFMREKARQKNNNIYAKETHKDNPRKLWTIVPT